MTPDEQIAAFLDAGNVDRALMIAATLPKKQAFLDTLKRVGAIVEQGMNGTTEQPADFELEAPVPGQVPERVIEELRTACHTAVDYAGAFSRQYVLSESGD